MACVLVANVKGVSKMPVYNFTSLRVACRTALSLMIGKNVYKDLNCRFVGAKHFEIWTKDAISLDYLELVKWYQYGYEDCVKNTQTSVANGTKYSTLYAVPKAKTLGLKYKDYKYQIFWAGWRDSWYDIAYPQQKRKLV